MILIDCPFCGRRDHAEFTYVGDATRVRPADPAAASDAAWADYLFMRSNPKGSHAERWVHAHGCRQWFYLRRHTVTHAVAAVWRPGEDDPGSRR